MERRTRTLWTVERARPEQAEEILGVQAEAFRENQKKYRVPLPALTETAEDVQKVIAKGQVLVAKQGDEIIGSVRVFVEGERASVSHLAVLPAYGHLAVGRSLMAAAEKEARSRSAQEVVLETGLRDAPAIEFYIKLGYRPIELIPDDDTEVDQVRFRRPLVP
ncbi:MAG: GNAT family N-acetyltransferase [Bacillota bacterium]|nr:GNAT family N-acetyltransferase [Bacillota bacterium]